MPDNSSTFPLVSIVCLTYNHRDYIGQTLDGFLLQRADFAVEIIVHDDCSSDGTCDIAREYATRYPNIRLIVPEENRYSKYGINFYFKYVIPQTRGKYIAFCTGDDYWIDPQKLQKQVDLLEKDVDCGLVYTKASIYWQKEGIFHREIGKKIDNFESLVFSNDIPATTNCIRRTLLDDYNNEIQPLSRPQWRYIDDYPIWLWAVQRYKFAFIDEVTTVYRILNSSLSNNKDATSALNYQLGVLDVLKHFLTMYGNDALTRKIINKNTVYLVPLYFTMRNFREIFRSIKLFAKSGDRFNVFWTLASLPLALLPGFFARKCFSVRNKILARTRKY